MGPHMALGQDPTKIEGARVQKGLVLRVWRFASSYRLMLAGFLATIVLAALIDLVPPLLIRGIIDHAVPDGDRGAVARLAGLMVAVAVVDEHGSATVINTQDGTVVAKARTGVMAPQFATLSPNGRALCLLGKDGLVTLWSLPDFQSLLNIPQDWTGDSTSFRIAAFSTDSTRLAVRWHDTKMRLWPASLSDLLKRADQVAPQPLGADERRRVILSYN